MTSTRSLTSPAFPYRDNEDALEIGADFAVVVDGAGLPKRLRQGCSHSVAWFSSSIARRFADRLAEDRPMIEALEGAIAAVRKAHAGTCDLDAGSPSATVAAWRMRADAAECLVLCDAAVILADGDGAELITDLRVDEAVSRRRRELAEADRRAGIDPASARGRDLGFRALESTRNVPGGFWCAQVDPEAARHALVRTFPRTPGMSLIAMSDGAARAFLSLGTHTVESFAADCTGGRLQDVHDAVRAAEEARAERYRSRGAKVHDDLTLAVGGA